MFYSSEVGAFGSGTLAFPIPLFGNSMDPFENKENSIHHKILI